MKDLFETIGLLANPEREGASALGEETRVYFENRGIRCVMLDRDEDEPDQKPELILTFGGDGTLLIGARYAMKYDIPLLGINLGTVGFLTEEDPEHLEDALAALHIRPL